MSTGSEVLSGTYLHKVIQLFPEYRPEDFWSLIFCGDNLDAPYDGWSGVVAAPVFSSAQPYERFFGEFKDSLAQYENVPSWRINYDVSRVQAFSEFRSFITSNTEHPVFISANAASWALPILTEAVNLDVAGYWNAQLICLRELYSMTHAEQPLLRSEYLGELFTTAPKVPKRFGLHAISDALRVQVPNSGTKAMYRALLTAKCAESCLNAQYPLQ